MEVFELSDSSSKCSYLDGLTANMKYFYIKECTIDFYTILLERGWRRFGHYFFVPICSTCNACITIRYDCESFLFSKSQKRVLKNPIRLEINRPHVTEEHLMLYDKYHRYMNRKKQWSYTKITLDNYYDTFVAGYEEFGYEFNYYFEDLLIGVALVDVLPEAISSVYCYYDHDFHKYSIGTYSILKQIEFAKLNKIPHLYPGYWIRNHYSMGYKERYKPFEILLNRPKLNDKCIWIKE